MQYAHARVASRAAQGGGGRDRSVTDAVLAEQDLSGLTDPAELGLIRKIAEWPRLIESAAEAHEPHRVAFYLYDLAGEFHALWNKGNDAAGLAFPAGRPKRRRFRKLPSHGPSPL